MKINNSLVSIIIPTKNSGKFLEACLISLKKQTYPNLEVILIDGNSTDQTQELAKKYNTIIYQYDSHTSKGTFDAPYRRNFGVKHAKGEYIYYVDTDMELEPTVIEECVAICCEKDIDAVIVAEDSFGEGRWARAKNLERRCYWGDDTIEAPRFFRKIVWQRVGGLDESLGGGGDDWDLYQKVLKAGYKVGRIKSIVLHNEGNLELRKLIKKRFMYGRDSLKYLKKRPTSASKSYFPIRKAYVRNWKLFVFRPVDTVNFIIMRTAEYAAGFTGILYSSILKK